MPASPEQVKLVQRVNKVLQGIAETEVVDYSKLSLEENTDIMVKRSALLWAFFNESKADRDALIKTYPYLDPQFNMADTAHPMANA